MGYLRSQEQVAVTLAFSVNDRLVGRSLGRSHSALLADSMADQRILRLTKEEEKRLLLRLERITRMKGSCLGEGFGGWWGRVTARSSRPRQTSERRLQAGCRRSRQTNLMSGFPRSRTAHLQENAEVRIDSSCTDACRRASFVAQFHL